MVERSFRYTEPTGDAFAFDHPCNVDLLDRYISLRNNGIIKEDARYILPLNLSTSLTITTNTLALMKVVTKLWSAAYMVDYVLFKDELLHIADLLCSAIPDLRNVYAETMYANGTTKRAYIEDDGRFASSITMSPGCIVSSSIPAYVIGLLNELDTSKPTDDELLPRRVLEFCGIDMHTAMSSVCYNQFKRHRYATILVGPYREDQHYYPTSIACNQQALLTYSNGLIWSKEMPLLGSTRRVTAHMDLRCAVNIVEQRAVKAAQKEIRDIALAIKEEIYGIITKNPNLGKSYPSIFGSYYLPTSSEPPKRHSF